MRGWRLILFARCEHASHAESDEWDGPIERDRWWAARLHRVVCKPCRRERRMMSRLRDLLRSAPHEAKRREAAAAAVDLSPFAAERMRAALREISCGDEDCVELF